MEFHALKLEDKPILDPFFRARRYENSHFNFTTIFIWRDLYDMHWAIEDDVLFLTAKFEGRYMVLSSFGPEEKMTAAAIKMEKWMKSVGQPFFAYGLEKSLADVYLALPGRDYAVDSSRNEADYLYNTQDLINLSGRKYHTKKNHLNAFWRSYPDAEYLPITDDIVPECKLNMNTWYKKLLAETPDDPYIGTERTAVMEILNNFPSFGLKGGALKVGQRIVAFTFGEMLNDDTVVIHVEKASPDVRGAYAAINQAFLEHEWADVPFVNRQEDMGLEGLRKAKESYRPVRMIEKFIVAPKGAKELEEP
ncbi:MAG: DUF2156 domain-containing protein [Selenomonadaceae bacterium]